MYVLYTTGERGVRRGASYDTGMVVAGSAPHLGPFHPDTCCLIPLLTLEEDVSLVPLSSQTCMHRPNKQCLSSVFLKDAFLYTTVCIPRISSSSQEEACLVPYRAVDSYHLAVVKAVANHHQHRARVRHRVPWAVLQVHLHHHHH